MFDLNEYLGNLIAECKAAFRERLLYMGLQGSYLRGEANENSDIDIMVILDYLDLRDMETYRSILKRIGNFEKSCGFICGKEEMSRWNPLEVCQLCNTTKDLVGSLADYLPEASEKDEVNYVKLSLGNLYHEICHQYIHADRAKNVACFRGTCKGLFFLLQNLRYLETGRFAATKAELMEMSDEEDRQVLRLSELPDGFDFDEALSTLFTWLQRAFGRIDTVKKQKEENGIETKRLIVYAASQAQMERLIEAETDDALKLAYTEMLNGCLNHPDQWEWYAVWMIDRKDGTHIGDLCFKGLDTNGVTEIGYGISEAYQNRGYATEAVQAALDWAFDHPGVTSVEAEAESCNLASQRVLEKCGFALNGKMGEEGPRYTKNRNPSPNQEKRSVWKQIDCSSIP